MTKIAEEAAALLDSLSEEKAREVLDFARYLVERADEEAWEKSFSDPRNAKKLREAGEQALRDLREGRTEPLDPEKL